MFRPFVCVLAFILLLASAGCGKSEGAKTPEKLGEKLIAAIEAKDMEAVRLLMTDTARARYPDPLENTMKPELAQWLARANAAYPPDQLKVVKFEGAEFLYILERGREGIVVQFAAVKDGMYAVEGILVSGSLYRRVRNSAEGLPDDGGHEEEPVEVELESGEEDGAGE